MKLKVALLLSVALIVCASTVAEEPKCTVEQDAGKSSCDWAGSDAADQVYFRDSATNECVSPPPDFIRDMQPQRQAAEAGSAFVLVYSSPGAGGVKRLCCKQTKLLNAKKRSGTSFFVMCSLDRERSKLIRPPPADKRKMPQTKLSAGDECEVKPATPSCTEQWAQAEGRSVAYQTLALDRNQKSCAVEDSNLSNADVASSAKPFVLRYKNSELCCKDREQGGRRLAARLLACLSDLPAEQQGSASPAVDESSNSEPSEVGASASKVVGLPVRPPRLPPKIPPKPKTAASNLEKCEVVSAADDSCGLQWSQVASQSQPAVRILFRDQTGCEEQPAADAQQMYAKLKDIADTSLVRLSFQGAELCCKQNRDRMWSTLVACIGGESSPLASSESSPIASSSESSPIASSGESNPLASSSNSNSAAKSGESKSVVRKLGSLGARGVRAIGKRIFPRSSKF